MITKQTIKKITSVAMLIFFTLMLNGCAFSTDSNLPKNYDIDATAINSAALTALAEQAETRHDKYVRYYTPDMYNELFRSVSGSYSGIGVYIYPDDKTGGAMIYGVMKNGPAYEAGILPGDVFASLNGEDLTKLSYLEVTEKLSGFQPGTLLKLEMDRAKEGRVKINVTTAQVDIPTVDYLMLPDNIGLIKIVSFNKTTGEHFINAYEKLINQGMQGMILDLRNNGGGELTAALQVCNLFVPKGEPMMYITGTTGVYSYTSNREALDTPTVILQNKHTASASEIVIGAARDNSTATLIGEVTYGKGIVQDLHKLKSGAGIRYTSAKYSTAHNNDIHGIGIEPDIYFPMPEDTQALVEYTMDPELDPQLSKAVEVVQGMIDNLE